VLGRLVRTSVLAVLAASTMGSVSAQAAPSAEAGWPDGDEVVRLVNAREDGEAVARTLVMELVEKGGASRTRVTRSFRRDFGGERRSVLFFESPANLKGTALLTWDDPDPERDDAQWLYLPGLRKSRRVAMTERGRAFLGTDLSFEDMKNETRLSRADYHWRTTGEETVDGVRCWVLEGTAVDEGTAREIGYGRVRLRVDAERWLPRFGEYWDVHGQPLKTVRLDDVRPVQGIWTAHRIEAENLRNGHRTRLEFRDVEYQPALPDDLFTEAALARGAP
jgi:outer membrane lipoprotein-sorting protein